MNRERLMTILLSPHVSENSTLAADKHRQFVFRVRRDASKPEIKKAVEQMFKVEVEAVQALNVKGKRKTFGRVRGYRSGWKKAYVRLKPGHDIDFLAGE